MNDHDISGIKENSGGHAMLWIFVAVGAFVVLLGAAIGIYNISTVGGTAEVTAVVTYADGSDVRISYVYDGESYADVPFDASDAELNEGDELTVRVSMDDPYVIGADTVPVIVPCFLMGFGILFAAFPLAMIVSYFKKRRCRLEAKKRGVPVECKVSEVRSDTTFAVNGKLVNDVAICEPLDGSGIKYVSAPFSCRYALPAGCRVTVYVLPDDPSAYCVDLSSLREPEDLGALHAAAAPEGYVEDPLGGKRDNGA